jgi:hypothetical protein
MDHEDHRFRLLLLSIIAGAVAPAAAEFNSTIERLDRDQRGGHGGG